MPKRLFVLYFCLYLSMIGYGISLPVIPFFLQELTDNRDTILNGIVFHVGAVTAVFALGQMVSAPLWGRLSDKTGKRKAILLIGLVGYTISLALTGFSEKLAILYMSRMLNGIFSAAVLPIASAYIIDVTAEKHRAKGLAWHGTIVGLGVVSGPAIGGYFSSIVTNHPIHLEFISINSFSAVFFLAALLSGISVILAGIILPETFKTKKDLASLKNHHNSKRGYRASLKEPITIVLILAFISQFALSLFEGTFVLHAQNIINFSAIELGYVFMVCGLVMALAQGTAVAGFIEKFGAAKIVPFGFYIMAGGLTLLMVGRTLSTILLFVGILAIGMAIIIPSVTVLISEIGKEQMGKNLGFLTGANSMGQTLGPLAGSLLFVINIHFPYLLAAAFLLLASFYVQFRYDMVVNEQQLL